jgi:NTE family protein
MRILTGHPRRAAAAGLIGIVLLAAGCASRPINPPLAKSDADAGYRFRPAAAERSGGDDLIVLAFSGGGTRAAAFSFGVLETLRDVRVSTAKDGERRLLDSVAVITGVSGGSFTALAYALHGERLFAEYEARFLKRDVEGTLLSRLLEPSYWGPLASTGWGRSELAADYYDEILFDRATFAQIAGRPGPLAIANATDLSSGARFYFSQSQFDVLCSDLGAVRLSRAAAASSAVPVVLSPVTFNNYGGNCGYSPPAWLRQLASAPPAARQAAARPLADLRELEAYGDGTARPYLHLVDGGVADNLALRGVLSVLGEYEALQRLGLPSDFDRVRRIVVFVVNSQSSAPNDWDQREGAPGPAAVLMQAVGVPINYYSHDAVNQLHDMAARWAELRAIRDAASPADLAKPAFAAAARAPRAELFVVDVSFAALTDAALRERLNRLPTSFVLPGGDVDDLRRAARAIVLDSPALRQYGERIGQDGHRVRTAGPGAEAQ